MARPTQRSPAKRRTGASTPQTPASPTPVRAPASAVSTPQAPSTPAPASAGALPPKPKLSPTDYLLLFVRPAILLLSVSLAVVASRNALRPLFGVIPVGHYMQILILVTALPSILVRSIPPQLALSILAGISALGPITAYQGGRLAARVFESWPQAGPVVVQLGLTIPMIVLSVNLMKRWMPEEEYALNSNVKAGFSTYGAINSIPPIWAALLPTTPLFNSCNLFAAATVALTLLALTTPSSPLTAPTPSHPTPALAAPPSPLRLGLLSIPLLLLGIPYLAPPLEMTYPSSPYPLSPCAPISLPYTSPNGITRLLARNESTTGSLSVAENVKEGYRYLRCDHSLLGGQWMTTGTERDERVPDGESIYAAFALQQAVRLVERPKPAEQERALVLGLGAGLAPRALLAHNVHTTVLELDPLIPALARDYFSFPEPSELHIGDARLWIHQRANATALTEAEKYDYVVHDLFTGGSVPAGAFSLEFWEVLRKLMKYDAVVAVNFAAKLGGNTSRSILVTLQRVFSACRSFHDRSLTDLTPAPSSNTTLSNIVIFCTPAASLSFRAPKTADYLSSPITRHVLSSLAERELSGAEMMGTISEHLKKTGEEWVLLDRSNMLDRWQAPDAFEHWKVMRQVMPAEAWETY